MLLRIEVVHGGPEHGSGADVGEVDHLVLAVVVHSHEHPARTLVQAAGVRFGGDGKRHLVEAACCVTS